MNEREMRSLLDSVIEAKYQENTFFYDDPIRPKPGPPASENDLRELDAFLGSKGLRAPKDYRLFLSIYNGIENLLSPDCSLLTIAGVIAARYGIIEELADEFPNCVEFVIGAGNTPEFVGFDIGTGSADGDYEVAWVTGDMNEWRSNSFRDFLARYLAILEKRVSAQKKDRENLAP